MQYPGFLGSRAEEENKVLLTISRAVIVDGAVRGGLIEDDDLAMVPEVLPMLAALAGELRDDVYRYHQVIDKPVQLPIVQNAFCYCFAKGAESAYLWHTNPHGKVEFSYSKDDALRGAAGAQVSAELAEAITEGMQVVADVFCDFQDEVLKDTSLGFMSGGRWLADAFACAFFWSSQVGVDFGMNQLGFP